MRYYYYSFKIQNSSSALYIDDEWVLAKIGEHVNINWSGIAIKVSNDRVCLKIDTDLPTCCIASPAQVKLHKTFEKLENI